MVAGDFHVDISSFLLGLYDERSRLKHCCSLLEEMCHILPQRRTKIKDVLIKVLQIIDGIDAEEDPTSDDFSPTFTEGTTGNHSADAFDAAYNVELSSSENQSNAEVHYSNVNQISKNKKTKHKCGICNVLTEQLPRHMKLHKWSKESSSAVVVLTGQRKTYSKGSGKGKDYHRKRWCPVESCKFVSGRIDKHLKNKHKELDENQRMVMLKLARSFTSIPEFPANSPEKRMIPVKETSTVVYRQNVFAAGSPSAENVNVPTNSENTGIERRLKPEALVYPPADLPPKHILPVTCEPKLMMMCMWLR